MSLEEIPQTAARLEIRELGLARRSTPPATWRFVNIQSLTHETLTVILTAYPGAPDPKAPLAAIRAPHHMLARFVAEGKPAVEISAITGYTPTRIQQLQRDPSFVELVAHYEEQQVMAEADIHAQVRHVAMTAGQILMERLEKEPEEFSTRELQSLFTSGLDRIGHGPGSRIDIRTTDTAQVIDALQSSSNNGGRVISRFTEAEFTEIEEVADEPPPQDQQSREG